MKLELERRNKELKALKEEIKEVSKKNPKDLNVYMIFLRK